MSLGSELKGARESRKISLAEITKKTKIPEKYLEAIEENNFDVFPSHTYAKGFIRAYAKVVGIDPAVLTRQFNAENQKVEMKIETKNAEADLEKALGWRPTLTRPPVFRRQETEGVLNPETAEEEFSEPIHRDHSVIRRKSLNFRKLKWGHWTSQILVFLAAVVLLVAGFHYARKLWSGIHWSTPPTISASSSPAGADPVKVADKYQHLVLKALDKSWVLVTMDDGQSSSEADMDQGEVKTYQAVKNFTLKLGNAGGVDVQFNGKPLGILGTEGQVVEIKLPPDDGNESNATDAKNKD